MKKTLSLTTVAVISYLLVGTTAWADDAPKSKHPCKSIQAACEAAGFARGRHEEGKGLFLDCMKPLLAGQSVPGVTVSSAQIDACKAVKAERRARREERQKENN